MFHQFHSSIDHISLPEKFNCPFHYTPHPLCLLAADEVKAYLEKQHQWKSDLDEGKMFGVLVVRSTDDEIGYLAAFSGNIGHTNRHEFFVPPIYDLLQPDGFFKLEEANISRINEQIGNLQNSFEIKRLTETLNRTKEEAGKALSAAKEALAAGKIAREKQRQTTDYDEAALIRESQFQKAEYKRLERNWKEKLTTANNELEAYKLQIEQLKQERKTRSAILQKKLFTQYRLLNGLGENRGVYQIFQEQLGKLPPAGTGECAAPKLLQYAFSHHYQPLVMAEFWWGQSPEHEIRRHGVFYPSCKQKCEPLLKFMLQGIPIEPNPLLTDKFSDAELEIIYEDKWMVVVNKPSGMLSVPGKDGLCSIQGWLEKRYPHILMAHRLDMDTSGLIIAAKEKEMYLKLQHLFHEQQIEKRYIALLDGNVVPNSGIINLPLCLNPNDRPRQMVSQEFGKPAVTSFEVLDRKQGLTRVALYPQTGRTHQLRVHMAHPQGLNTSIKGDNLYGSKADRLYLHAESLIFTHPMTKECLHLTKKAPF